MTNRHPNCQDDRCQICLEDHAKVSERLEELTQNYRSDLDGYFHHWLKCVKKIEPETEWGWGTSAWFDDGLIQEFAEWWEDRNA